MAATYVIGDVHGSIRTLQALLDRLPWNPDRDRLWLTGDLVNRGPASLEVLRWGRETAERMGERFRCVLGNHDLHLLAVAEGLYSAKPNDTLEAVLAAPDKDELLRWLDGLPLLHREEGWILVHAGLWPRWKPAKAVRQAKKAKSMLAGAARPWLLSRSFEPAQVPAARRKGVVKRRQALEAFTRLRTCTAEGVPCEHSGPPEEAPPGCLPWFEVPGRRSAGTPVVFGHWAALGFHRAEGVLALDSGCAWGKQLTAVRLEDGEVFQQDVVD